MNMSTVRNFCKYAAILPAFLVPVWVDAATISVGSGSSQIAVGSTVVAYVQVDSEGIAINNAEGTLTFPSDIFDVVSVSQSPSIFTLWIQSPSYSSGGVSFNGGLPAPGYTGSNGRLFSVTLRAKAAGVAALSVGGGAVRANDGLGTDVLRTSNAAVITVAEPTPAPAAPTPAATPDAEAPKAVAGSIAITSTTHPDEDAWYSASEASLLWKVPAGADAVQTLVGKIKGATPSVIYRPAIAQKTTTTLEDGVWYFNLRGHTTAGWGPISSYKIQVDTTAPVLSEASVTYDPQVREFAVRADAQDALSGVKKLELVVDGETLPGFENSSDVRQVAFDAEPGAHTAVLKVTDAAGNTAESRVFEFIAPARTDIVAKALTFLRSLDAMWLMLVATLLIACLSLVMNVILWRAMRTQAARAQKKNSGVTRLQKGAKQKLLTLKKDLQKQSKQLDAARSKPDIVPQDAASLDKTRKHLKEAEEYIEQKIKDVS